MTSNGDPALNSSSIPAGLVDKKPQRTPSPRPSAPKAASPSSKENRPLPQNGDHDHVDAQNESEAETVVLGNDSPEKKVIKTERNDNDTPRLRSIEEDSRPRPQLTNGRRRSSNAKEVRINGAKHGSERDAKSPEPTSPSSRTTSRHTKDTSPTDSTKSPVQSAISPAQTTRGRSASTTENRKRKLRDESFPKAAEPPRQKAKTEGLKESRQANSPATPGFGRPHKRSQSTQSAVTGVAGRKRRETTSLALSVEPAPWASECDSDDSSSPPAQTPNLQPHTRLKRSAHRALTSPARTMAKPKVDKFGATRLAREAEKGDLDAVKEAYEDAPDELDQVDYAGIAPLQKASLHGWADVARFLISKGCNTACESSDRDTPLIDAVENSHLDVVEVLLDEGHVDPWHSNKKGQRAIDVLDREDDDATEIEKVLREAMRRENSRTRNEIQPERVQAKTGSRLLYNEYNVETLIEKAGNGDTVAVGELLNSNIKPNIACGIAAARGGYYDILSVLLASGLKADPDPAKHPETPITAAIGRGNLEIVELLLEQDGFDPTRRNKEGKTYYEIAEEKEGPGWKSERDVLKAAYDDYKNAHSSSPRRQKKEPPYLSVMRMKRNSLPKRERSPSLPRDTKRASLTKSTTAPQKSRRLMSGKEMANREGKRRKKVVDDESSEDESEEDVRPPTRKVKPRSYSLGEENKPAKPPSKARSDDNDTTKRKGRAASEESEDDHGSKPPPKIRKKIEKPASAKPTPEIDSPDERKVVKNKIKYKTMDDKIKKRKLSDASTDAMSMKKTPTASAKSTPAPPERTATPEAVRERRQEEQRLETEARRKAAEAAAEAEKARKEEEEAARKAAEEAESKRQAEAAAEVQRQAEEAEAARKREEEEAQRRAEEEAKRQEMLAARQNRISRLPRALRRACELGSNRPLHFSGEELGISVVFLPLHYTTSRDLQSAEIPEKTYICSYQLVGILGLPELDLAHLDAPYAEWPRIPVTHKQRQAMLRQIDIALLAQDFRFPMEGTPGFDYTQICDSIKEAKNQFLAMEGLYWIEESLLRAEMDKVESLKPLLKDIESECGKRRIHADIDASEKSGQKLKPRKSFMDLALPPNGVNGTHVNGDAG
ncbi:hypothetical protein EK21DRAFT_88727 [Setomelanomma holmii]|uniref:Uncharacterized protein n=1 Tax=Setomelanomma holmii TaxID=210430 RepID=A0A9P4LM68_9PLEO|nr:hypothetical protein EK21DRAFT_88727 [Setomelanomma holmii]